MAEEDEFGALFGGSGATAPQPLTLPLLASAGGPAGKGSADAEEDAEVYIQLFGSAPPLHLPPRFAGVKPVMPIVVIPRAAPVPKPTATAPSGSDARSGGSAAQPATGGAGGAGRESAPARQQPQPEPGRENGALEEVPHPPQAPPPDEDDDFEVTLEELDTAAMNQQQAGAGPGAVAQMAAGGARMVSSGSGPLPPMGSGQLPPLGQAGGADAAGPRPPAGRPPAAPTQPPAGIPGPRPPLGAPPPGPHGSRPAFGPGPPGGRPFLPRQPQPIYGLNFRYNIEEATWPTEARLDQAIKLPKQTRVTPEEYRAFLSLGHGEIYELDLDRIIPHEASWRNPSANPGDYFNYDMNETSWRHYCSRVKTYRDTFNLRNRIAVLDSAAMAAAAARGGPGPGGGGDGIDPTLPPEVIAALRRSRKNQRWEEEAATPEGLGALDAADGDADALGSGWDGNEGGYGLFAVGKGGKDLHRRRTVPRIDPDVIITLAEAEEVGEGEAAAGEKTDGAGERATGVKEEPEAAGEVKKEAAAEDREVVKVKAEGDGGGEGAAGGAARPPRRLGTNPPVNSDYDAVPLYPHELAAQQMPGPPPRRSRSPQPERPRHIRWQDGGGPQAWEHEEGGRTGGGRWEGDPRDRDHDRGRRDRRPSPHEALLPPLQQQAQQPAMPPMAMGGWPPMGVPPGGFPVDIMGQIDMGGDFYLDGGGGDADGDDDADGGGGGGAGGVADGGRRGSDTGGAVDGGGGGEAGLSGSAAPGAAADGMAALLDIVKVEPQPVPEMMPPLQPAAPALDGAEGGPGFDHYSEPGSGGRAPGWAVTDEATAYGDFSGGDYYMDDGYGNADDDGDDDRPPAQAAGAVAQGSDDRTPMDDAVRQQEPHRNEGDAATRGSEYDLKESATLPGVVTPAPTSTGPPTRGAGHLDDDYNGPAGAGGGGDAFFGDGGGAAGGGALSVMDLLNPMAAIGGMGSMGPLGAMGPMGALGAMHGLPMPGLLPGGMPPLVPGGMLGMAAGGAASAAGGGGAGRGGAAGRSAGGSGSLEGRLSAGGPAGHRLVRDSGRDAVRDVGRGAERPTSSRRSRSRSRSRRSRSRSRDRTVRRDRNRSRSRSRSRDRDRERRGEKERRSASRDRDRDRGSAKERRRSRSRDRDRRDRDRRDRR